MYMISVVLGDRAGPTRGYATPLKLEALPNFIAIRVINKFGTLNLYFDLTKL